VHHAVQPCRLCRHGQPTPAQASLNAGPGRRPEGLEVRHGQRLWCQAEVALKGKPALVVFGGSVGKGSSTPKWHNTGKRKNQFEALQKNYHQPRPLRHMHADPGRSDSVDVWETSSCTCQQCPHLFSSCSQSQRTSIVYLLLVFLWLHGNSSVQVSVGTLYCRNYCGCMVPHH